MEWVHGIGRCHPMGWAGLRAPSARCIAERREHEYGARPAVKWPGYARAPTAGARPWGLWEGADDEDERRHRWDGSGRPRVCMPRFVIVFVGSRPGHPRPGHSGPGHAGPGDAGPGDAGPGHAGPGHPGPRDAVPLDAGPGHPGPRDAGPGDPGPGHARPGHAVPVRPVPETGGPVRGVEAPTTDVDLAADLAAGDLDVDRTTRELQRTDTRRDREGLLRVH